MLECLLNSPFKVSESQSKENAKSPQLKALGTMIFNHESTEEMAMEIDHEARPANRQQLQQLIDKKVSSKTKNLEKQVNRMHHAKTAHSHQQQ